MKNWITVCFLAAIVFCILALVSDHIIFYVLGGCLLGLGTYYSRKKKQ